MSRYGLKWWWCYSVNSLTYRPSTESKSFGGRTYRQEFSEWREKVAATAVMELYVNLAPFSALKQAPDFPLPYSTFMQQLHTSTCPHQNMLLSSFFICIFLFLCVWIFLSTLSSLLEYDNLLLLWYINIKDCSRGNYSSNVYL